MIDETETPLYWLKQAQTHFQSKKTDQAILDAEEGLAYGADYAPLHAFLATAYASLSLFDEAHKHYKAARAFAPDSMPYTLALIDDYLRIGDSENALIYLSESFSEENKVWASALFLRMGKSFFLTGQWQEALKAFLQVLSEPELKQEEATEALLYAMEIMLRKMLYAEAQSLLQDIDARYNNTLKWVWSQFWARVAYWQGDFGQAKAFWREALEQRFSEAVFCAVHLLAPPVAQSLEDERKWNALIEDATALFKERPFLTCGSLAESAQLLFNPFDYYVPQNKQECKRLNRLGDWYLGHFVQRVGEPTAKKNTDLLHISIVTDVFSPAVCCFLLPWLKHYLKQASPAYKLTVFYFSADDLPDSLLPYQRFFYQLPVHIEAALVVLEEIQPDILLYTELRSELYRLALTPPTLTRQYLYPVKQFFSGLESVSQEVIHQLCEHKLLLSMTPAQFYADTLHMSELRVTREQLSLPSLGHIYLFATTPLSWSPAFDALANEILARDRKAFIVAFQVAGTTLHTHIQQRHDDNLSKPHRIRWLNLSQQEQSAFLTQVNGVVGTTDAVSELLLNDALARELPVAYFSESLLETPLQQNLKTQSGSCVSSNPETVAEWLVEQVVATPEHVKLENRYRYPTEADLNKWESILLSLEEPS